jgi:hypothetical protein
LVGKNIVVETSYAPDPAPVLLPYAMEKNLSDAKLVSGFALL